MVLLALQITAELENLTDLQPLNGCDDPDFTYLFKLRCMSCGELTQKETALSLSESLDLPVGKGTTHLIQKCKFCGREGMITMVPGYGRPLTHEMSEAGRATTVMAFDCRGYEPVGYIFADGWRARSLAGTSFESVDLSEDEYAEYDEKGECPVMISKHTSSFVVMKA